MAGATPFRTIEKARDLRRAMSLPEVKLWQLLRGTPNGLRFRRQHPLGPYVLDFYCAAARLIIEVDGTAHDMADRPARDAARTAWLNQRGLEVVRVPARDILRDVTSVADGLLRHALARVR